MAATRRTQPVTTPPLLHFASALLVLLSLVAGNATLAQAPDIRFETPFSPTDAAIHQMGGINTIVQDSQGFIWMGAENGLGRYDGRQIRLYQADPRQTGTLPASYVWYLAVDHDGVLWAATEGGLARYNSQTDDFTHIRSLGGVTFETEAISALAVGADNTLYVGAFRGLYVINPQRTAMSVYFPRPPIPRAPNAEQIRNIAVDPDGNAWLATAGMGVAVFNPQSRQFRYLLHDASAPDSLLSNSVRYILHDSSDHTWLGTYSNGITRIHRPSGKVIQFRHTNGDKPDLKSGIVWDITEDSEGIIWAALDQGGLARYDEHSQSFHHYLHSRLDPNSPLSNQLRVVYEDRNSDLWIGAFPSGVNFYNRSTQAFQHFLSRTGDNTSLSHNAILRVRESRDGTIWVGTEGGLNALDPKTGEFRRYLSDPSNPEALGGNPVLAIAEDIDGQLWIGTWAGGLHRFNPETGIFHRYRPDDTDPNSIQCLFIWDITLDSQGRVWIGTETAGLARYNRESDNFTHFSHDPDDPNGISGNFISAIREISDRRLWLGTFTGLDAFDPETETFFHFPYETGAANATSSKNIRSIFEDSRQWVWVGTQHRGVNIYDHGSGSFRYLDIQDGLPSSNIASIVEDEYGYIWLATANGLARIEHDTMRVTTFSREDGLAGSHFNRDASFSASSGHLYFGSAEGLTVLHPDDLGATDSHFPVLITHFRVLNEEVPIDPEGKTLKRAISLSNDLRLDYRDTMFSFDFAALNYRNSSSVQYSYKLEGFDRDWNNIGRSNTATYTNISPGRYTFRTRASLDGEVWVEGQTLAITIVPPPWRTWWAYSLYVMCLLLVLYFRSEFIKLRIRAEVYKSKSITDPLTLLYNRAGIAQIAEGIFANEETRKGICLMLLDIDHFKRINDHCGHDTGDRVLTEISRLIRSCIRHSDHLGRWGGEEFVLLCSTQGRKNSKQLAEKVRTAVEQHLFETSDKPLRVTVSIGLTHLRANDSYESALKRADHALYQAKAKGRNCVISDH